MLYLPAVRTAVRSCCTGSNKAVFRHKLQFSALLMGRAAGSCSAQAHRSFDVFHPRKNCRVVVVSCRMARVKISIFGILNLLRLPCPAEYLWGYMVIHFINV